MRCRSMLSGAIDRAEVCLNSPLRLIPRFSFRVRRRSMNRSPGKAASGDLEWIIRAVPANGWHGPPERHYAVVSPVPVVRGNRSKEFEWNDVDFLQTKPVR